MKLSRSTGVIATLLFTGVLLAQPPTILSVANSVSGEAKLAPGLVVNIRYTPLGPSDLVQSRTPTVTTSIGTYGVFPIQGVTSDGSGGGIVTVMLPKGLGLGATTIVVTNSRGSSPPFPIMLNQFAPAWRTPWINCENGRQVAYFNAVGLGPTNPEWLSSSYPPLEQQFPVVTKPIITVGGAQVEVVDPVIGMPPYDLYAGSFRVPPEVPEGSQPTVLSVGGVVSNTVNLVVGTSHVLGSDPSSALDASVQVAAPDSIVYANGCTVPFAAAEYTADPVKPPATLAGLTVTVTDSAGVDRVASILSISPQQVKYIVPAGTANGRAKVTMVSDGRAISSSPIDIAAFQPGVFWSTMYLVRVHDGKQIIEEPATVGWFQSKEIDFGPDTDEIYLVVLATGFRHRSTDDAVSLQIPISLLPCGPDSCPPSGLEVPVQYAGPQGQYAGVDQINVRLPRIQVEDGVYVNFRVAGKRSNDLYIHFLEQ